MVNTVKLRHYVHTGDGVEHFYDGQLTSKAGVLEIPAEKTAWIQRAYMNGYDRWENGESVGNIRLVLAALRDGKDPQPKPAVKSTESVKKETQEVHESPTDWRQSVPKDRVRES